MLDPSRGPSPETEPTRSTSANDAETTRWVLGRKGFEAGTGEPVVFMEPAKVLRCERCRVEIALVRDPVPTEHLGQSLCRDCAGPSLPSGLAR